jgi:hypothetical protein
LLHTCWGRETTHWTWIATELISKRYIPYFRQ